MIDADEVRAVLRSRDVLDHYGWSFKRSGDELQARACPSRSDHSRERAFVLNAKSGRWQCFPCGTSGDLFDFVAAVEGLSMPSDFSTVVERAAAIAGIDPSVDEAERRRRIEYAAQRRLESEREEIEERARRNAAAVPLATSYWERLLRGHHRGVRYLAERAVDEVVTVCDAVRFDPQFAGSPALALFTSDGQIRNVVERRVPELGEPKTPGLYRCPSAGTMINAVCQIESDRDVVIAEGVMDSITARLAWRYAIVLGAHGAGNLPIVARAAIPFIVDVKTRLTIAPHRDRRGFESALEACRIAVDAGLSISRGTLQIVKLPDKDLNDAWRRGWRPAA